MSIDIDVERNHPTRLNSETTRVGEDEQFVYEPSEKIPRISIDEAYNPAPRRQSRVPNLKGPSPIPGSHPEFPVQYGEVPWHSGDPHRYATPKKGDSWQKCHKLTEKYDNEMCDAWKEEVDKLLIFAGLFSATVTAFTVESYKWLAEDEEDATVQLLAFIASQMAGNTSTQPPIEVETSPFSARPAVVVINAAWFLSLTLSLSTVLIGILCLQWLREYQRDAALPHKEAVALRQMRYEGLLHWRVPEILSILPLLLQSSLVLFFAGLLYLLWDRNTIVAACVSSVAGVVMIFLVVTTALPALQHAFVKDSHLRVQQCPYKSPQSWLVYRIGHALFWVVDSLNLSWSQTSARFHRLLRSTDDLNWMVFDMRWRQLRDAETVVRGSAKGQRDTDDIVHGLQWINNTFTQSVEAVYPIYHALADLSLSASASTISGFYLEGNLEVATLRVMLDDRFSPTEYQKRDILSAYYLRLHQGAHGVLKASYLESLIRILNTQDVPLPFYDWLSEILQELVADTSPSSSSSTSSSSALSSGRNSSTPVASAYAFSLANPELLVQVLLCVKKLVIKDKIRTLDMVVAWALLHRLLSPTLTGLGNEDFAESRDGSLSPNLNMHRVKLACGMFVEFERWIARGRERDRMDRVKLCAEGMLTLFPPTVNFLSLVDLCEADMENAFSFIRYLQSQMETFGGPELVLSKERWWLDYWEVYSEKDWDCLVESFEALEKMEQC